MILIQPKAKHNTAVFLATVMQLVEDWRPHADMLCWHFGKICDAVDQIIALLRHVKSAKMCLFLL